MVRRGDFKLIVFPKVPTVLLYDLKNDPYETKNLADRPEHAKTVTELLAELEKQQKETGDTMKLDVSLFPGGR